jgi:hypothetical protein
MVTSCPTWVVGKIFVILIFSLVFIHMSYAVYKILHNLKRLQKWDL